jgi:hypothetical protein
VFGVCLGCHTFALKKLAVMVNGTTYAKKLRLNTRNGNIVIDIKKINCHFLTF